jgi:hypothetical protein
MGAGRALGLQRTGLYWNWRAFMAPARLSEIFNTLVHTHARTGHALAACVPR